jgi:hypothetical protein
MLCLCTICFIGCEAQEKKATPEERRAHFADVKKDLFRPRGSELAGQARSNFAANPVSTPSGTMDF